MTEITVNVGLLEKVATFTKEATPVLEKTAQEKQAFAEAAPGMVDAMIEAGVLNGKNRDAAIRNLVDGGLSKCAELVPFLSRQIQASPTGKPTADGGVEKKAGYAEKRSSKRQSDDIWEQGMMA